jgi:DNA polymerase-3 subunit alpha
MGFPGYFLVVADFINWSKNNGIRVGPGRGSGAGSMAAYAMRITDLDPLRHGLIFERFLNPDRVSMPDFDVDFDERRRGEVIRYVTEKYGDERVAQIVTYGTIKAKQALKDSSSRARLPVRHGREAHQGDAARDHGQGHPAVGHPRHGPSALQGGGRHPRLIETDAEAKTVFETALGLENLKRQWGVHAAGVIMSSDPLIDIIPIMKREQDGQIVTQFDYPACESLGLIKMDFLGLRNLTIIDDAARQHRGEPRLPPGARRPRARRPRGVRAALARRHLGVFQLDGGPMRSLPAADEARQLRGHLRRHRAVPPGPDGRELAHQLRPAQERPAADHADPPELEEPLKDILDTSYGLIIYQEQVMAIAQRVAGLLARTGRHPAPRDGQEEEVRARQAVRGLLGGMKANGFSDAAVKTLWDILLPFSDYAFNKAHSAAYGVLSYWTAYLKAHYPAEYMAACSRASATRATSSRSTSTSAAAWASRCSRPT